MAQVAGPQGPAQHLADAAASAFARTQSPGKHLAVHAPELAVKPHLQILRRYRRPLLLCLEHADQPTLEDHVHCSARLGNRASFVVRVGIIRDIIASVSADRIFCALLLALAHALSELAA